MASSKGTPIAELTRQLVAKFLLCVIALEFQAWWGIVGNYYIYIGRHPSQGIKNKTEPKSGIRLALARTAGH